MRDQGVIFGFIANAAEGERLSFNASIAGVNILYNNGLNNVDITFTSNDLDISANPLHRVKIGATANDTLLNLKSFFETNGYFSSSININYELLYQTISSLRMHFFTEETIYFEDGYYGSNVIMTFFDADVVNTINLKYFFIYTNISNDLYRCDILQKGFSGNPKEINGRATLTKGESKDHLDPIRGSGLSLKLEANSELTFEDLYFNVETDFVVRFYRNNVLVFSGFLKPDGITQSYTRNLWDINIECVDGLGFLSDLSFTKTNGLQFIGKMSMLDIIYNCLKKTGQNLELNTCVELSYLGMPINSDVLKQSFLSVDRFVKSDDNTIMSCSEVLSSILTSFSAAITQQNGKWFVYRVNDFFSNNNPIAKRYDLNNVYVQDISFLVKSKIGSQIDGIYPYHCNGNQQISINGAFSAFRLGYKYGFIGSILGNGNLKHPSGTKIYENWIVDTWVEARNTGYLVIDPVKETGIQFKAARGAVSPPFQRETALISNDSDELQAGFSFEFKTRFISYGYTASVFYSVILYPTGGTAPYNLNQDGTWTLLNNGFRLYNWDVGNAPNDGILNNYKWDRSFSINSDPLPIAGVVQIKMEVPYSDAQSDAPLVEVKSIELINTFNGNNVVGEFHTVSRSVAVSSIVKETKTVSIGDNSSIVYRGAIYKGNTSNLTDLWTRKDRSESKPLLRIAAEDNLRIAQRPVRLFYGSTFGFSPYLSLYEINKITGKYMPISWNFDTYTNMCTMKLLELHSPELNTMDYLKTDDYGETVKPTITS